MAGCAVESAQPGRDRGFPGCQRADDPRHLPELVALLASGRLRWRSDSRLAGQIGTAMPWTKGRQPVWCPADPTACMACRSRSEVPSAPCYELKLLKWIQEMTYGLATEMIRQGCRGGWPFASFPVDYPAPRRHPRSAALGAGSWRTYHILTRSALRQDINMPNP